MENPARASAGSLRVLFCIALTAGVVHSDIDPILLLVRQPARGVGDRIGTSGDRDRVRVTGLVVGSDGRDFDPIEATSLKLVYKIDFDAPL